MFHSLLCIKVVILILYFYMCIRAHSVLDATESEKYNFNRKSASLHNVSIEIIYFLDMEQQYVKLNKSQALLAMFKHQNHIAQNLLSTFDRIQNMTASNVNGNSFNLRNILEDIIREEMHHSRNYNVENSSVNWFDREFSFFVNMFFNKAFKISVKNVMKITNRIIKTPILNTPWKRTRDIKVWKPSSLEHFDLFDNTRRIYKGKKAKIKDFPFLVSILINNEFSSAGSIISKDLVITAATGLNVLYKSNQFQEHLSSVIVRVGSDYAVKEGNLVSVVDVIFHPGYDPHSLQNNLAIVRLVKRLRFSDKRKIQRILYDKKGVFKKNSSVIVLGWGAKDANKEVNFKQKVSVTRLYLFDMDKCATMYSRFYVKDSNFCAGFSDKGGGACNKDTGGPGIVGGELAGVISFGPSVCGQAASPTVFTKIAANVEWITSVINGERSLMIQTSTTRPETNNITYTIPTRLPQIPVTTTKSPSPVSLQTNTHLTPPPAPTSPQLASEALNSRRPLLRLPKELKFKRRLKSHRFNTVTPEDLSTISLPFSTTYFHPTLYSESASLTTEIYPDQSIILKEILKEIILSNTSVIDYILYGDILEDNVEAKYLLSTTEAVDVMHHQLVNKSIFLIEKPEEIMHPVRSKISKPIAENSHESSSYDQEDISSQIEFLNLLFPQPGEPDTNKHIVHDNNFKEQNIVPNYNIDTSGTESSKKKVTDRFRNTILYENIRNSNDVADDLSSKVSGETKDNIDEYDDDVLNVKTTKDYEKQTKTELSTTSTTKMYKTYKNVVLSLDDFDPENQQDKMEDRIGGDKHSDKGKTQQLHFQENQQDEMDHMGRDLFGDDYNKKQEYNKNNFNKNSRFTPNENVKIGDDKYNDESVNDEGKYHSEYLRQKKENKQDEIDKMEDRIGGDKYSDKGKTQQLHFQENQQDEMDHMGRDLFGDDYNKKQEYNKNNFNKNSRFTPNENVKIGDDKYNDESVNDEGKYHSEYLRQKKENKQDEIDRTRKDSSGDNDNNNSNNYQKNKNREPLDYNQNKEGRMERFTLHAPDYDYDDDGNIPQRTTENNLNALGKAATISNDEFDYNYKDTMRQNDKNENSRYRHRLSAYNERANYNQRPMTDEDEKETRYYERKSNKRQVYKKSNLNDEFLSIL